MSMMLAPKMSGFARASTEHLFEADWRLDGLRGACNQASAPLVKDFIVCRMYKAIWTRIDDEVGWDVEVRSRTRLVQERPATSNLFDGLSRAYVGFNRARVISRYRIIIVHCNDGLSLS